MASDDWGCGSSFGEAKSLSELVEGLTSKKIQENHTDSLSFPAAEAENQQVQVVPCVLKIKNTAPKILKKKSSINKMNREPNLKKVTFEVEQLLARESSESVKNEATERLVISLGGLPSKRKNINYKLLKDHLATKKDEKKTKEIDFSPNRVIKKKNKKKMPRSRSRSMSRSRGGTPIQRSRSPSRSRSPPLRDEYRRRTPSPSRRYSRKSRSRTPDYRIRHGGGNRRGGAWAPNRSRENPDPSRCVGIFNLSLYTTEKDLKEVFGKYGDIDKVELVYDHPTGRSRGFGFVYFTEIDSATNARDELNGSDLDGHKIRVDYSITKRAHTPTPGQYMGGGHGPGTETGSSRPPRGRGGRFGGDRDSFRRRESYREGYGGYGGGHRRRSPSPPPRRRRSPSPRRYRSRSRSY